MVQWVCVTASVSIVSLEWLKAGFERDRFYFGIFLFAPRSSRGASMKFITELHCPLLHWRRKTLWVTRGPFSKQRLFPVLKRVLSPRRTVLRAKLQVWMSPPYEDVLQLMSHEGRPDRIHIGGDGLNKSRLPGFLLRDFKWQQFISPTHPSSILPISKFISVLSLPLSTFI